MVDELYNTGHAFFFLVSLPSCLCVFNGSLRNLTLGRFFLGVQISGGIIYFIVKVGFEIVVGVLHFSFKNLGESYNDLSSLINEESG